MESFALFFFSLDIKVRAAVLMALCIIIFWWILGKIIIRILAFLLYLLRGVFKGVYLLIEIPVCWIHGKTGSFFYEIDNALAGMGEIVDSFLEKWRVCWSKPKDRHIFSSIVVYFILLIWICIPYHADEEDVNLFNGQDVYLSVENKLVYLLELQDLYDEQEWVREGIAMRVITQTSPLPIRDIPSIENGEVLESAEKDSTVYWRGGITFKNVGEGGAIEPWIKVKTPNGAIGWARLIYLCPVHENDLELKLKW